MGLPSRGHIQMVTGCMFAGKTQELMRRLRRYKIARMKCLLVKHTLDTRYDRTKAVTHEGDAMEAISAKDLTPLVNSKDIDSQFEAADVIAIDEGQFFPDLVEACVLLADQGKIVIVAALDGDFKMEPFAPVSNLYPHAQSVVKLSAVCIKCTAPAAHSKRLVDWDQETVVIGGKETYAATCRACHKLPASEFSP